MIPVLLAQILAGHGILGYIILAIIVAGAVAILFVVLRQFGVTVPAWIITICWIVLAVFIGVIAVKLLAGML